MKHVFFILTLLALSATPALAQDPEFNIEEYCKRTQTNKTAYNNCLAEERSVREEVLGMDMSDDVFNACLEKANNDPNEANYYSFMSCVNEASGN